MGGWANLRYGGHKRMGYIVLDYHGEYTLNMRKLPYTTFHFDIINTLKLEIAEIFVIIGTTEKDSMVYIYWYEEFYTHSDKTERDAILDTLQGHIDKIKASLHIDFPIKPLFCVYRTIQHLET